MCILELKITLRWILIAAEVILIIFIPVLDIRGRYQSKMLTFDLANLISGFMATAHSTGSNLCLTDSIRDQKASL